MWHIEQDLLAKEEEEETTRLRSKARAISPDIVQTLQGNMPAYEL